MIKVLISIKQWETIYFRDMDVVRQGVFSEEVLFRRFTAMYYSYVGENGIEPFTISYGRGDGFRISANSYVGVITYNDITLYITSMIPELSLGKILFLKSQSESNLQGGETGRVIRDTLSEEETISAIDYFVVSLIESIESIRINGFITEIAARREVENVVQGKLQFEKQIKHNPAYDRFHVEKSVASKDILLNRVILSAILKAETCTKLDWILPFLRAAVDYFSDVSVVEDIRPDNFPKVSDYTALRRDDYERALLFSKYILYGYDPIEGAESSFFPEFMIDMDVLFEFYVTRGLQRIFRNGFDVKCKFTLGLGPQDIPIDKKYIELDGYYNTEGHSVVIDTKNKYRSVIDRDIPEFIASNADLYQQYYYASRLNSSHIVLVYPSSRRRTAPLGSHVMAFSGCKSVNVYFWGLHITGTPRDNKNALISLARFLEGLAE